jgi:hypothetical protein
MDLWICKRGSRIGLWKRIMEKGGRNKHENILSFLYKKIKDKRIKRQKKD